MSRSTSLFSTAKTITQFIFGEVKLPAYLLHYAAFFAGLATGTIATSKLYEYLDRNKRDRAKVQFAVYHIIRMFEHHPDYQTMLKHPQELLKLMEPDVLHMVGKHLTKHEAVDVTQKLKRKYESPAAGDHVHKRVRGVKQDVVQERMGPGNFTAYSQPPRGFLPEAGPVHIYGSAHTQVYGLSSLQSTTQLKPQEPRSDTPVQDDNHVSWNWLTSDQKQLRFETWQHNDDLMDIDDTGSPCPPPTQRSAAPSPKSSPASVGIAPTSTLAYKDDGYEAAMDSNSYNDFGSLGTPFAKVRNMSSKAKGKRREKEPSQKPEGYGFRYEDFLSSDEDSPPPSPPPIAPITHPSPVLRMVDGVLSYGTLISPIAEGSSVRDAASSLRTHGQDPPQEQVGAALLVQNNPEYLLDSQIHLPASVKAILNFSTTPVEEPASEDGATEVDSLISPAESTTPVIPTISPKEAQLAVGEAETETILQPVTIPPRRSPTHSPGNSSPPKDGERCSTDTTVRQLWPREEQRSSSKKRKSVSPELEQEQDHAQSPPSKRVRSSPLGDITASYAAGSSERQTSSQHRSLSPSPTQQPLKRGRRRGTSSQPKVPKTPKAKKSRLAETPFTHKTTRTTKFEGVYTK